jgi:hypothetical protein
MAREAGAWRRLEIDSRGDRVVVRLRLPDAAPRPAPLVLFLDDAAAAVEPLDGVATLTFDLPLLGERSSPKWSERLRRCLGEGPSGAADAVLLDEFRSQAAADATAALDACAGVAGVDAERAGLLVRGAGRALAPHLRDAEPRLVAVAWLPGGLDLAEDGAPPGDAVPDGPTAAARLAEALAADA